MRFIIFSMGFLHFGYAYALIGLEINIRLDLISNVRIIIPETLRTNIQVLGDRVPGPGQMAPVTRYRIQHPNKRWHVPNTEH